MVRVTSRMNAAAIRDRSKRNISNPRLPPPVAPGERPEQSANRDGRAILQPRGKRAALFVRVSTANRSTRNQAVFDRILRSGSSALRQMASLVKVYSDRMSGAKDDRPGLNALMQDPRRDAFDVVVVWRFDRFARSTEQLVLALTEFRTLGIDFVSSQEALDTSTPMGKAMFTIIGAMAELKRNVIRERIVAGLGR